MKTSFGKIRRLRSHLRNIAPPSLSANEQNAKAVKQTGLGASPSMSQLQERLHSAKLGARGNQTPNDCSLNTRG